MRKVLIKVEINSAGWSFHLNFCLMILIPGDADADADAEPKKLKNLKIRSDVTFITVFEVMTFGVKSLTYNS